MRGVVDLLKRFHSDERGVFAVIFGVMAIVLVAFGGAAVDYTAVETARTRMQLAMDSAALGLASKIYDDDVTEEDIRQEAEAIAVERLNSSWLTVEVESADMDRDAGTLRLDGRVTVPMSFVQLVGINTMTAAVRSEATRGTTNLEVALAIDITKSMEGEDQIGALETASSELIDIIVKDVQEPTYSRMAVVPYSMGVNVGSYADAVRGAPVGSTDITAASWFTASKNITAATRANPVVITSNSHGYSTNDRVYISGVNGMTNLNGNIYCIAKVDDNKFSLKNSTCTTNVNGSGYSSYSSSGTARKCTVASCKVRVTSAAHGIADAEYVYITNVGGMTQLNNKLWQVESVAADTYVLKDALTPTSYGNYSSGGKSWCTRNDPTTNPCQYFRYVAADGSTVKSPQITNCVTERVTNRYTDAPPSTTWLGRHYPDGNSLNTCITNQIVPLTSDKDVLHAATTDLVAAGSTSGHIGLAWGWYLLSHDFSSDLFDFGSENVAADPDVDGTEPVMKVLVLMTDGLFNTNYCNGVVAKNADSVAGNNQQRINCNGVNSTTQGEELCDAIDDDNIVIYTVAFALQEISDADDRATVRQMLADCATADGGAYEASNGDDLLEAFRDIGRRIANLRLSL